MAVTSDTTAPVLEQRPRGRAATKPGRPAGRAATRVARAGLVLSGLGLVASLFVLVRLFETWRIGPHAPSHAIAILGVRLSYPVANADALIVLVLASAGFIVAAMILGGATSELLISRRVNRRLASTRLTRLGDVHVIEDDEPRAFCAGLLRPRVYISSGALAILDESALEAVVLHERHHAGRRDPLRLAAGRVMTRALFFLPWISRLHHHEQALAELSADESAVDGAPGNRSALARAMLTFVDGSTDPSAGIDPARVDYLLGEPPSWRFPALLCVASLATIGLIVAVAILAGRLAAGTATFALPFLSSQPCVVILAVIPAAAAAFVSTAQHSRGRRLARR